MRTQETQGMGFDILLVEKRGTKTLSCGPLLEEKGYHVASVSTRRGALEQLENSTRDLLIVDGRLLRFDPVRFCQALRRNGSVLPVLLILPGGTGKSDSGATLVLRGKFTQRKLLNWVKRLLASPGAETLRVGEITLDLKQRTVIRGKKKHQLTPKQAQLLEVFIRNQGKVLTRRFLMKEVWKTDFVDDTRTLEVHVHWLRKAIEKAPSSPVYLTTVRRLGYRFDTPFTE